MKSYLRAPLLLLVVFTLVMLVIFTVTSFQHGGSAGAPPTPYPFRVINVTLTPAPSP